MFFRVRTDHLWAWQSAAWLAAGFFLTGSVLATYAADSPVLQVWLDETDGPASLNDAGRDIVIAADGTVYVTGSVFVEVQPGQFESRLHTARFEADGSQAWVRLEAGTGGSGTALGYHIALGPTGDVYAAGSLNGGDDWAVVRYQPDGTHVWTAVHIANSSFLTQPDAMVLDAAGNVFLVGTVGSFGNPDAGNLVKINAAGTIDWSVLYTGPDNLGADLDALALSPDGRIIVAGSTVRPSVGPEFCVASFDATGGVQWVHTDGVPGLFSGDRAVSVAVDADGTIVASGDFGLVAPAGPDIAVTRLSAAGVPLWTTLYDGPAGDWDFATAMSLDTDGSPVVVGRSRSIPNDYAALTLRFEPGGDLAWERRVEGAEIHFDVATDVTIGPDGEVTVVGDYDPIGGSRAFITQYAADGTERWFLDYANPLGGSSRAAAVAWGPGGQFALTGVSAGDILSIGYLTASTVGGSYCGPQVPNSTGMAASLEGTGYSQVGLNCVLLEAASMPPNRFGYFLASQTQGFVQQPGNSQGNLCLGGTIGRFTSMIFLVEPSGTTMLELDLTAIPVPGGSTAVVPGDTWNFQAWFRDVNPAATSNFTTGLSVMFD